MDYRTILKKQLAQRKLINSRFSMRSLAQKIELSPSKLSEIMRGSKSLSVKRAEIIADKLGLRKSEREIFVLSTLVENEGSPEAKTKLKNLIAELNGQKTAQKNAWYFGAVKALEDEGLVPKDFIEELGLTELQVENAQRFLRRIRRFHPERERVSFEPASLLVRLQDDVLSQEKDPNLEFVFLNEEDAGALEQDIRGLLRKYRLKSKKTARSLRMVYFTQFEITKKR